VCIGFPRLIVAWGQFVVPLRALGRTTGLPSPSRPRVVIIPTQHGVKRFVCFGLRGDTTGPRAVGNWLRVSVSREALLWTGVVSWLLSGPGTLTASAVQINATNFTTKGIRICPGEASRNNSEGKFEHNVIGNKTHRHRSPDPERPHDGVVPYQVHHRTSSSDGNHRSLPGHGRNQNHHNLARYVAR
jgi:hypothetical protein